MTEGEPPCLLLSSLDTDWEDIAVEQWQYPALEPPERSVEAHELVLSLTGPSVLEWRTGGRWQQTAILPGACCLTPAGVCLQKRWPAPTEDLIVRLSPAFVTRTAEEMRLSKPVELLEQHGIDDPQIRLIGLALQAELSDGSPSGRLFADSLASALAARLLTSYSAIPPRQFTANGGLSPSELRRALDYIQDHLALNISLDSLANAVGTSPSRLTALFKQSTGWSPHQYVLRERVERAKRLLEEGSLSPGQVALRVGFYDQSHLNRHFKRFLGVTPKEYVRRL